MDAGRKTGDVTLVEQETVDSYYYYVSIFEDRFRDGPGPAGRSPQ